MSTTIQKNKRVYLQSLGCPKNLVDSEIMLGTLASQGYQITPNKSDAEIIIVNTCGFLQASSQESIDTIVDLAKEKKHGDCEKLIVAGCLSQRYPKKLSQKLPDVDLFIGTNEYPKIADLLNEMPEREYIHKPLYVHKAATPRILATGPHTAYVKIAEGCNHACSFCIIPKLRGKQRSRSIADIRTEVENLIQMGCKEFNLIAQDTTDYGCDLHNGTNIEGLLKELAQIPGDHWFRLMYAYPLRFSDELIDIFAESENICRYVDIPFQHINNKILKSMHRGSNSDYIRRFIDRIRKKIPHFAIRSTLIVGYPGEDDAAFEELLTFVKEVELEHIGVFTFSEEEGTPAATLSHPVPQKVRQERQKIIMQAQQKISLRKKKRMIGQTIKVLVENKPDSGPMYGRSEWDAPEIDGKVYLKGDDIRPGVFCQTLVKEATPYDITGMIHAST